MVGPLACGGGEPRWGCWARQSWVEDLAEGGLESQASEARVSCVPTGQGGCWLRGLDAELGLPPPPPPQGSQAPPAVPRAATHDGFSREWDVENTLGIFLFSFLFCLRPRLGSCPGSPWWVSPMLTLLSCHPPAPSLGCSPCGFLCPAGCCFLQRHRYREVPSAMATPR